MTAYGALWPTNNTSPVLTRLGAASGWAAGAGAVTNFSAVAPWSGITRCNVWDDGTKTASHGDRCYTDTDVTNMGQAMVKIPPFYSYVDTTKIADGTTPRVAWWISDTLGDVITNQDATTHTIVAGDMDPAFMCNGVAKSKLYIGAYHAYNNGGVLESVAGVQPSTTYPDFGTTTSTALTNMRAYAQARGVGANTGLGWNYMTMQAWSALQLLYLVEYANFDAQAVISEGISNLAVGSGNQSCNTGHTSIYGTDLGNTSGNVAFTAETQATTTYAMSYRGVENAYGNLSTVLEGCNVNSSALVYYANHTFADDTYSGTYTSSGITPPATYGSIESFYLTGAITWPFICGTAITGAGGMTEYVCDGFNAGDISSVAAKLGVGGYWAGIINGLGGFVSPNQNGMFAQNFINEPAGFPKYADGVRLQYLG